MTRSKQIVRVEIPSRPMHRQNAPSKGLRLGHGFLQMKGRCCCHILAVEDGVFVSCHHMGHHTLVLVGVWLVFQRYREPRNTLILPSLLPLPQQVSKGATRSCS